MSTLIKLILNGFVINLGFFLTDALWINALSLLNLSYGTIRPPLFIFTFLRSGIFFFWIILQLGLSLRHSGQIIDSFRWYLLVPQILLLGFGLYGFFVEPFRLTVSQLQIPVQGLTRPIRIVQLSDIHVERITPREQAIPQRIESLHPDMIVVTGDFINESYINNPQSIDATRELIGQLKAPLGVYGVNGNVETHNRLRDMLAGLNITILDNQVVRVPEISQNFVLIGLNYVNGSVDEANLTRLMTQVQLDDFSLLLYHKPDLAYAAHDNNVKLYLAGHTHGGQVRAPFYGALFSNSRYGKTFEMGQYQLGEMTLFVSRGLGFTGGVAPRIRFLAPPEIVAIDLIPTK